jgi:hypothetical protein
MTNPKNSKGFHLSILQRLLPLRLMQIPVEIVAGLTLAVLAVPEVMGSQVTRQNRQ